MSPPRIPSSWVGAAMGSIQIVFLIIHAEVILWSFRRLGEDLLRDPTIPPGSKCRGMYSGATGLQAGLDWCHFSYSAYFSNSYPLLLLSREALLMTRGPLRSITTSACSRRWGICGPSRQVSV